MFYFVVSGLILVSSYGAEISVNYEGTISPTRTPNYEKSELLDSTTLVSMVNQQANDHEETTNDYATDSSIIRTTDWFDDLMKEPENSNQRDTKIPETDHDQTPDEWSDLFHDEDEGQASQPSTTDWFDDLMKEAENSNQRATEIPETDHDQTPDEWSDLFHGQDEGQASTTDSTTDPTRWRGGKRRYKSKKRNRGWYKGRRRPYKVYKEDHEDHGDETTPDSSDDRHSNRKTERRRYKGHRGYRPYRVYKEEPETDHEGSGDETTPDSSDDRHSNRKTERRRYKGHRGRKYHGGYRVYGFERTASHRSHRRKHYRLLKRYGCKNITGTGEDLELLIGNVDDTNETTTMESGNETSTNRPQGHKGRKGRGRFSFRCYSDYVSHTTSAQPGHTTTEYPYYFSQTTSAEPGHTTTEYPYYFSQTTSAQTGHTTTEYPYWRSSSYHTYKGSEESTSYRRKYSTQNYDRSSYHFRHTTTKYPYWRNNPYNTYSSKDGPKTSTPFQVQPTRRYHLVRPEQSSIVNMGRNPDYHTKYFTSDGSFFVTYEAKTSTPFEIRPTQSTYWRPESSTAWNYDGKSTTREIPDDVPSYNDGKSTTREIPDEVPSTTTLYPSTDGYTASTISEYDRQASTKTESLSTTTHRYYLADGGQIDIFEGPSNSDYSTKYEVHDDSTFVSYVPTVANTRDTSQASTTKIHLRRGEQRHLLEGPVNTNYHTYYQTCDESIFVDFVSTTTKPSPFFCGTETAEYDHTPTEDYYDLMTRDTSAKKIHLRRGEQIHLRRGEQRHLLEGPVNTNYHTYYQTCDESIFVDFVSTTTEPSPFFCGTETAKYVHTPTEDYYQVSTEYDHTLNPTNLYQFDYMYDYN